MGDVHIPEFVGVQMSLPRLVGWPNKVRNPWSATVPTIISNSTIVMRWVPRGFDKPLVRALSGYELMKVTGWTDSMWAPEKHGILKGPDFKNDCELLTSLAGNAFNGHALPCVIVA
eukprot:4557782-Pyramimonas_sp.AAC.2